MLNKFFQIVSVQCSVSTYFDVVLKGCGTSDFFSAPQLNNARRIFELGTLTCLLFRFLFTRLGLTTVLDDDVG